jgi:hypothetical protein
LSFSISFSNQNIVWISIFFHAYYLPCQFHPRWIDHFNNIWWNVQVKKLLIMQSSPASCRYSLLGVSILSSVPCSQTPSISVRPFVWETEFNSHTKQQIKWWSCTF